MDIFPSLPSCRCGAAHIVSVASPRPRPLPRPGPAFAAGQPRDPGAVGRRRRPEATVHGDAQHARQAAGGARAAAAVVQPALLWLHPHVRAPPPVAAGLNKLYTLRSPCPCGLGLLPAVRGAQPAVCRSVKTLPCIMPLPCCHAALRRRTSRALCRAAARKIHCQTFSAPPSPFCVVFFASAHLHRCGQRWAFVVPIRARSCSIPPMPTLAVVQHAPLGAVRGIV